jgi:hypothetical protein
MKPGIRTTAEIDAITRSPEHRPRTWMLPLSLIDRKRSL